MYRRILTPAVLLAALVLASCTGIAPMNYSSTSCSGTGAFAAWAETFCPSVVEGSAAVKKEGREALYGKPLQGWERTRVRSRKFEDLRPERLQRYDPIRNRNRFEIRKESWVEHGSPPR